MNGQELVVCDLYGMFRSPVVRRFLLGRTVPSAEVERQGFRMEALGKKYLPDWVQTDLPDDFRTYVAVEDPASSVLVDRCVVTRREKNLIDFFNWGKDVVYSQEVHQEGPLSVEFDVYRGDGRGEIIRERHYDPFLNDRKASLRSVVETRDKFHAMQEGTSPGMKK